MPRVASMMRCLSPPLTSETRLVKSEASSPIWCHCSITRSRVYGMEAFALRVKGRRVSSSTVPTGKDMSCGMYAIHCLKAGAERAVMSSPSMLMKPSSKGWSPMIARSSVVFPHPDFPLTTVTFPSAATNDSLSKRRLPLWLTATFFNSSIFFSINEQ